MKTALKSSVATMNILLVEDNPGDAFLVRQMLEHCRRPVQVGLCADGVEAMAYLHHQDIYGNTPRPDLILLDLDLPRKGGWDVLLEIKEDMSLRKIPIIILTGSAAEGDFHRSCFSLANDFIRKPQDWDHMETFLKYLETNWILPLHADH
jgi:CheY-like chemotaxis protein